VTLTPPVRKSPAVIGKYLVSDIFCLSNPFVPIRHMSVTQHVDLMIKGGVTPRFLPTNHQKTDPEQAISFMQPPEKKKVWCGRLAKHLSKGSLTHPRPATAVNIPI
jgi:hypothetical protein